MKIAAWNCRGAASSSFRTALSDLMYEYKSDLLFSLETRMPSTGATWILDKFHYTNVVAVEARGFTGGLWCFWSVDNVSLKVLSYTAQTINVGVLYKDNISWLLSLVYGSPVVSLRDKFCDFVERMSGYGNVPWCMIGDFNQVVCQEDKLGGRKVTSYSAERMRRMLNMCDFQGVDFSGPRFTWTNNQPGSFNIRQRLDQCWCNSSWHDLFPSATVRHLPRVHSDHHLLLLSTNLEAVQSHHFRFQNG